MITRKIWKELSNSIKNNAVLVNQFALTSYELHDLKECVECGLVNETLDAITVLEKQLQELKSKLKDLPNYPNIVPPL